MTTDVLTVNFFSATPLHMITLLNVRKYQQEKSSQFDRIDFGSNSFSTKIEKNYISPEPLLQVQRQQRYN